MKKILLSILMLIMAVPLFAATSVLPEISNPFISFLALAAGIPVFAEVVISLIKPKAGLWTQIVSILVGMAVTMFGWWLGIGFLAGLIWWHALIVGLCASLAANGIWDIGLYETILKAIGILKK